MAMDYDWLADKLTEEYKEVFEKAELFACLRKIEEDEQNEMLMDLLDVLLAAQEEKRPVGEIVGPDLEKFCNSYFSGYTLKSYLKALPIRCYRIMKLLFVIEFLTLIMEYVDGGESFGLFQAATDLSGYGMGLLLGILISFFGYTLVRPFMFRWKRVTAGLYNTISLIVALGASFGIVFLMVPNGEITIQVPIFPVLLLSGGYILVYWAVRAVYRYRHHGNIRREWALSSGEKRKGFWEQIEREIPPELVKRYEKRNARLVKRGKEPLTPEEYTEWLRERERRSKAGDKLAMGIVGVAVLGAVIQTALTSTFVDTIIFIILLAVAEIPVVFMFRASYRGAACRKRILEECDRRGITVIEYCEEGVREDEVHGCVGSGDD